MSDEWTEEEADLGRSLWVAIVKISNGIPNRVACSVFFQAAAIHAAHAGVAREDFLERMGRMVDRANAEKPEAKP
jgi:hypothetical protein